MSSADQWLGVSQYANYKGVAMSTIQDALKAGSLPYEMRHGRRMINVKEADKVWAQKEKTADNAYTERDAEPNLSKANAYMKAFKAKLTELEYQEKKGLVIEKKMVYNQLVTSVRVVRDALRNLPQKIAPEVAAEVDPHACEMIMVREIDEALDELSRLSERFK